MGTPAVTRELSITYGGVTVGGTSDVYLLDHSYPRTVRGDYESITATCTVQVVGSSEALFVANCKALETEFMEPYQDVAITLGSESWAYSHASNTGVLARPSWEVVPHPSNSARSRLYECSVTVQRPADYTGKAGLRVAQITVTTDLSGRRTLDVAGTYTSLSSAGATAQFTSAYPTYLGTLETALTGTWERGAVSYTADDEDKVITFRVASSEPGYSQAGSSDHAAIKGQSLTVSRTELGPGDRPGVVRLRTLAVAYEATIVRSVTTDLDGFYHATIKPFLLARVRDIAGSASIALVRQSPSYDHENNRITVALEVMAAGGSGLLAHSEVTQDEDREPIQLVPVWDGNPFARASMPVPAHSTRAITITKLMLGAASSSRGGEGGGGGGGGSWGSINDAFGGLIGGAMGQTSLGGGGGISDAFGGLIGGSFGGGGGGALGGSSVGGAGSWVRIGGSYRTHPYRLGIAEAFIDVTEIQQTDLYEWAEAPSAGGGVGY